MLMILNQAITLKEKEMTGGIINLKKKLKEICLNREIKKREVHQHLKQIIQTRDKQKITVEIKMQNGNRNIKQNEGEETGFKMFIPYLLRILSQIYGNHTCYSGFSHCDSVNQISCRHGFFLVGDNYNCDSLLKILMKKN